MEAADGVRSYPNALNIFLTKRCNLDCRYCFVKKDSRNEKEISTLALKKAVNIFLTLPGSDKKIGITGGEPLLSFDKIKYLSSYIQKENTGDLKSSVTVTTNGTALTLNRFKFIKKNKVIIRVSVDGKKAIHDYNRPFRRKNNGSTYERIVANLNRIQRYKNGHNIGASLVFSPQTAGNLLENIKSLWKLGFNCIDFYPDLYAQWDKNKLDKLELTFRKFTDFYLSIFKDAKEKKDIFENSLLRTFISEEGLYKPILCQKIHLDWKGNFYCCDKVFSIPGLKRKSFIIGDVHKGIDNGLRIKLLEEKRKEIRNLTGKDCNSCKYLKYCFCAIGHYIYFSSNGLDFKQYFPQFCRLSQIYNSSFLEIKRKLLPNHLFSSIYRT
ncbi:MAG: radical SAM protein [Candidatus Omnitrophota bacterium]